MTCKAKINQNKVGKMVQYKKTYLTGHLKGQTFVVSDLQFVAHARSLAALSPAMPLSRIQRISDKV